MKTHVVRHGLCSAVAVILLTLLVSGAAAQSSEGLLWGLSYQVSVPMGKTADFSKNLSWRGFGVDGRYFLNETRSVGLAVSWNVFHEKAYRSDAIDNGAISGTQFRDINAIPILATAHWYFGEKWMWRPYVGGGLGLLYAHQRLDVGLFRQDTSSWQLALAPEVGLLLPYDQFLGYVGARWNYGAGTKELPTQSYMTFMIGVGLR